jgi:hypothetical protein
MSDAPDSYSLAEALSASTDPYYAAFGRFITGFATTEGVVRSLLEQLVKTSKAEGAALFHKLSVSDTIATINRLLATRDATALIADVKEPFIQLQAIGEIRNALVHWDGRLTETDGFIVKNTHRAHLPTKVQEYRVGIEQLVQMTTDLIKIDLHILTAMDLGKTRAAVVDAIVQPLLAGAWLYIRPV